MDNIIQSVKLKINGNIYELSLEEARKLHAELSQLLGYNSQYFLPPIEIPMHTPYKSPPIWQNPTSPSCFGFQGE